MLQRALMVPEQVRCLLYSRTISRLEIPESLISDDPDFIDYMLNEQSKEILQQYNLIKLFINNNSVDGSEYVDKQCLKIKEDPLAQQIQRQALTKKGNIVDIKTMYTILEEIKELP